MIYGSSDYPIEVRKIRLKIWKFRDELESVIQERLDKEGGQADLSDLEELYRSHIATTNSSVLKMDGQDAEDLPKQKSGDDPKKKEGRVMEVSRVRPPLDESKPSGFIIFSNGVVALMDINKESISCFLRRISERLSLWADHRY